MSARHLVPDKLLTVNRAGPPGSPWSWCPLPAHPTTYSLSHTTLYTFIYIKFNVNVLWENKQSIFPIFYYEKSLFFIPSFSALYSASHREGDLEAIPEPRNSQSVLETINWLFSFRGSPLRPTDPTYLAAFRNPGPPRRPAHSNHTQKPRPGDLHHRYTLHAPPTRTPSSSRPLLAKLSNHTYKNA